MGFAPPPGSAIDRCARCDDNPAPPGLPATVAATLVPSFFLSRFVA